MNKRYEQPIPLGWYALEYSEQLAVGEVKALHYLGRELVLFRTESGQARVVDAFCPHLGAHLGHGGIVVGENIACPFHGWEFDGTGKCTEVPYHKKTFPKKAAIPNWEIVEPLHSKSLGRLRLSPKILFTMMTLGLIAIRVTFRIPSCGRRQVRCLTSQRRCDSTSLIAEFIKQVLV